MKYIHNVFGPVSAAALYQQNSPDLLAEAPDRFAEETEAVRAETKTGLDSLSAELEPSQDMIAKMYNEAVKNKTTDQFFEQFAVDQVPTEKFEGIPADSPLVSRLEPTQEGVVTIPQSAQDFYSRGLDLGNGMKTINADSEYVYLKDENGDVHRGTFSYNPSLPNMPYSLSLTKRVWSKKEQDS